jgi:transcription termination/antitermination protein NusG
MTGIGVRRQRCPRTEGGEALLHEEWFAIWTHSHCEQLVHDHLAGKGFRMLLPTIRTWSRRAGKRRLISLPMFPGYLFVHCEMDKGAYIEVLRTRGVVRILGERWDRLAAVPDTEIDALQRLLEIDAPILPHPYLHEGQRVRITDGALAGVEGLLVRSRPNRGLLVLSVNLLHQSVAVEIDCTAVTPVAPPVLSPSPLAPTARLAS